ncbi:uncharacterized protein AB675_11333 [Cyphellophora attinorum]|uniref:Uncharacterized protein n=1 Tax=Cyphellophora attinorum TaxID=1664694 RepID=A0A0N0NMA3_9EURO|nr:uncharacterized protein AB675_11333 [Phialophora attinorum]KPI39979.1 hypothetical protein AB675_11333 [Phialophora attinorum]
MAPAKPQSTSPPQHEPPKSPGTIILPESVPDSQSFRVAQLLSTHLASHDDLKYSMTWLWGAYISELPRHMVYHPALSAAVETLLMVHQTICVDSSSQARRSHQILLHRSYIEAITSVRLRLDLPNARREPEMLCAVFILSSISPYFEGVDSVFKNPHAKGAIEILRARKFSTASDSSNNNDSFDTFTLSMLRNATALKAIVDGEEDMTPADWEMYENSYQYTDTVGRLLRCAVRTGRVFAFARTTQPQSPEEAIAFQQALQLELELEVIVLELEQDIERATPPANLVSPQRPHAQALRNYTQALVLYAQILCLLQSIRPLETNNCSPDFEQDIIVLVSRTLSVAEQAKIYRPLGANWIVIGLMATWCATMGTAFQMEVAEVMDGWRAEGPKSLDKADSVVPRGVLYGWWRRVTLGRGRGAGSGGFPSLIDERSGGGGKWAAGYATAGHETGRSNMLFVPARTALY